MFTHFKNRVFFSLLIFSLFKIFRLDFLDFKVFSSVLKKKEKKWVWPSWALSFWYIWFEWVSCVLGWERCEQERAGRDLVGAPVRLAHWLRPTPIQKTNNHNFAPRTLNPSFPLVNFKSKRAKTASFYHTKNSC